MKKENSLSSLNSLFTVFEPNLPIIINYLPVFKPFLPVFEPIYVLIKGDEPLNPFLVKEVLLGIPAVMPEIFPAPVSHPAEA